jgi:class 3 adenylate cyclase
VNWFRRSFGAKLLSALFGTVLLLLLITFIVVRGETARQIDDVTTQAIERAERLFGELTDLQRQQTARLAEPLTEQRDIVRMDEWIRSGDFLSLSLEVDYEMQLAGLPNALLVFTDADGQPVLTIVEGESISTPGADPAGIGPMAAALLASDDLEKTGYRLVEEQLYGVTSLYIEDLGGRPVGTITFGLPISATDVADIGMIGGFDACFYVGGRCVISTPGVDEELTNLMDEAATTTDPLRTSIAGRDLFVSAAPLDPEDLSQGLRVIAIPLDDVLVPFERIERALALGGGVALLLSALVGVALSRSLTRPMKALVAATGRVAEGDYEAEVSVTSHDEMGTLASAFNEMARGLLAREQFRAVLNKVVSRDVAEELMKGEVELGGESRLVTVLFADIRSFTPLTEGMEPQEVIALLNECMEYLSDAIDEEGGVVDKFIGDAVMAVFGAPVTQDDHARRAIAAAMRMRVGMATLNAIRAARGDKPLSIGVGINSGVAVAGNMGSSNRMNYTVVGDVVNLASRLAGQAARGEILISGATLRIAGPGLKAPPLGGRALKGFSAEVEVYAVESFTQDGSPAASRASA